MRLRAITPVHVTDQELRRRQDRYNKISPPGIVVELVNLPSGPKTPLKLESSADIDASHELVAAEALRAAASRFSAVLPDCVLDSGVSILRASGSRVSALGILETVACMLRAAELPFLAVARNAAIGAALGDALDRYGVRGYCRGVVVLGLTLEDVADEQRWNEALVPVRVTASERRIPLILNGCSAADVTDIDDGVRVLDPARVALRLLECMSGRADAPA